MDVQLADRAAVVTGGASGIGLACVAALSREGARVLAIDRDDAGRGRALEAGAQDFCHADVTDEAAIAASIGAAENSMGGLDLVVCAAGISGPVGTAAWEVTSDQWDEVMAVNAKGPFLTIKHATPHLAASEVGAIVVLASDSSFVAIPGMAPYCASKGAVLMLVRALAADLEPRGVRINCVCPSVVDTPMSRTDLEMPGGFDGTGIPIVAVDEVARHVTYLLSPGSGSINGASVAVDLGFMAWSSFPDEPFRTLIDDGPQS